MQLAVPGISDPPNHLPLADDFPDVHCEQASGGIDSCLESFFSTDAAWEESLVPADTAHLGAGKFMGLRPRSDDQFC